MGQSTRASKLGLRLAIKEIPALVHYSIHEYDGLETVSIAARCLTNLSLFLYYFSWISFSWAWPRAWYISKDMVLVI
jgi:hypothetical protein